MQIIKKIARNAARLRRAAAIGMAIEVNEVKELGEDVAKAYEPAEEGAAAGGMANEGAGFSAVLF